MTKSIHTLVQDIYNVVQYKRPDRSVDAEAEIDKFGEAIKDLMRKEFTNRVFDSRKLRLSNLGRDDRFLWHHFNNTPKSDKIQPHTLLKFMYGHLIEELLLFLTRMSGHEITHEQHPCDVEGIVGSMDCKIDGIPMDIKSCSTYAFKKFKDGTLAYDDPFGYVAQIKAYASSENATKFGWLAMDKQNGHLTTLIYDEEDYQAPVYEKISYDINERAKYVQEMVKGPMPRACYEPVADGKSGNMRLDTGCSYCSYKGACYPNLRVFLYSTGPKFLTEVVNEPKVQEIPLHEVT